MNIETLRAYCLAKKGVSEGFPFDNETLVFKVMGKIFALTSVEAPDSANLKCDPEYAVELREQHPLAITPGYHMSKKHWNTVSLRAGLTDPFIKSLIDHSYELVVKGLTRAEKAALSEMEEE